MFGSSLNRTVMPDCRVTPTSEHNTSTPGPARLNLYPLLAGNSLFLIFKPAYSTPELRLQCQLQVNVIHARSISVSGRTHSRPGNNFGGTSTHEIGTGFLTITTYKNSQIYYSLFTCANYSLANIFNLQLINANLKGPRSYPCNRVSFIAFCNLFIWHVV